MSQPRRGRRIVIFGWAQSVHVQRWVTGLRDRGFQIKLISLGGEAIDGIETCVFPYGGKTAYLWRAPRAAREARAFRPDLVHVHYAGGFGVWGLWTGHRPTIVSVWGTDLLEMSAKPHLRWLLRRLLNRATWVTATSRYLRKSALRITPDIERKISIIPFGVNIPTSVPPPPNAPPVKICFIKGHLSIYGPDILLRALAIVRRSGVDIRLTLAGQGEMTPSLRQLAADLNLESTVQFVGQIDHRRLYSLLGEHQIMVMPSLREGFGVAALEASACGRPVIATNVGGVPEVVIDGDTGLLVPPGDVGALAAALTKLAADRPMREHMGLAGHDFVKRSYDWNKSLDMMASLYERLINEAKKNPSV